MPNDPPIPHGAHLMTDEAQRQEDNKKAIKTSPGMKAARLVGVALLLMVCFFAAFIGLLQVGTFERMQVPVTAEDFLRDAGEGLIYEDEGMPVHVPEAVVGSVLRHHYGEGITGPDLMIESTFYDGSEGRFYLNLTYKGFYLPLSYSASFEQLNNDLQVTLSDGQMTKFGWSLGGLGKAMEKRLGIDGKTWTVSLYDFGVNTGLSLKSMAQSDRGLELLMDIDRARVSTAIEAIRADVDPVLLAHYQSFERTRTAPVLDIVMSRGSLRDGQFKRLVNSALGNHYLLKDLLLITDSFESGDLMKLLEDYGVGLDVAEVKKQRHIFKGQTADEAIAHIFTALEGHFEAEVAFNQGKPFDLEAMETITVRRLVERYDVPVEEALVAYMSFVYDDGFKVAYELEEDVYYIRGIEGFEVVDGNGYKNMTGSGYFTEPVYVTDRELWAQVTTFVKAYFDAGEVFVRYMKSDGNSVFAVVSTDVDPQDYWSMAMMVEEGGVKVLEENVTNISAMMAAHPDFNVEAATKAVETAAFKRIGNAIHELIIEELKAQRILAKNSDTQILYSSFDGAKYIALKLSDGQEYVYSVEDTVYGTYLATVYTKDKALRNWPGIPELILLQEVPEDLGV